MEALHLFFLAVSAVGVLISDHDGWRYFRGKIQTLPVRRLRIQHRIVWSGLIGLILTGAWMMWPARSFYLSDAAFLLKMTFVGVLLINGLFIGKLLHTSTHTPFSDLSATSKAILLASGAMSFIGWVGSAAIGFLWL